MVLLTPEVVELLTSPQELAAYKNAIMEALVRGTKRHVESEEEPSNRGSRVNDNELFTRLLYYGSVQLKRSEEETWLTPIGLLLDLWECHKQYNGLAKMKREYDVDEIIPIGILNRMD